MLNQNKQEEHICIGGWNGQIHLYEVQQQQHQRNIKIKSLQTFPNEHLALYSITSLLQLNENTLISSSNSSNLDSVIVIWLKFNPTALCKPVEIIT